MWREDLTEIVIAVQDYKKYGFSNTVHTDKGTGIQLGENGIGYYGLSERIGFIFEEIVGSDFGKKDLILPANSYGNLIQRVEQELRSMLQNQKRIPIDKDDDIVEMLSIKYVINRRKDFDKELESFHLFYTNLKSYYDKGYPLYLSIATPEDVKKHFGNFKAGDHYEPISNQNKY